MFYLCLNRILFLLDPNPKSGFECHRWAFSLPFSLLFDYFPCGFQLSFSLLDNNYSSEVNNWETVLRVSRVSQDEIATDFVANCLTDWWPAVHWQTGWLSDQLRG